MGGKLEFDEEASTRVEAIYATPDVVGQRHAVLRALELRPGGRAVVLDTDWATTVWHSDDRARMERVLAAWAEHAAHLDLPRTLTPRLKHYKRLLKETAEQACYRRERTWATSAGYDTV
jgi:hypothetical protein